MKYFPVGLKDEIRIKDIVTVHYFEYTKNYKFPGESHNFWEMVYVDRGQVIEKVGEEEIILKSGDIFFHKPNEWHSQCADGANVANVAIISFISNSKCMNYFEDLKTSAGSKQKELISKMIEEGRKLFGSQLGDPYIVKFKKNEEHPFACEQLIRLYLTEFLISIIRNDLRSVETKLAQNTSNKLLNTIMEFMEENISKRLSLEEIEIHTNTSRTAIESAFNNIFGCGAIKYFIKLKIEYAKVYIREENYNMTQIAELLGYESVHYFSRQFKQVTGMSPKEYSKSIKAIERH